MSKVDALTDIQTWWSVTADAKHAELITGKERHGKTDFALWVKYENTTIPLLVECQNKTKEDSSVRELAWLCFKQEN